VIDNISCEEVEDLLKTLNTNKALGPEKSFLPSVVDKWNKLPLELKQIENFKAFKNIFQVNKPKSKHIYYCGERNVNIQHARLRMQCSLLRGHLH